MTNTNKPYTVHWNEYSPTVSWQGMCFYDYNGDCVALASYDDDKIANEQSDVIADMVYQRLKEHQLDTIKQCVGEHTVSEHTISRDDVSVSVDMGGAYDQASIDVELLGYEEHHELAYEHILQHIADWFNQLCDLNQDPAMLVAEATLEHTVYTPDMEPHEFEHLYDEGRGQVFLEHDWYWCWVADADVDTMRKGLSKFMTDTQAEAEITKLILAGKVREREVA